jgi:hypothetical protein
MAHHQGGGLEALVVDRQHVGLGAAALAHAGDIGFVFHIFNSAITRSS